MLTDIRVQYSYTEKVVKLLLFIYIPHILKNKSVICIMYTVYTIHYCIVLYIDDGMEKINTKIYRLNSAANFFW